MPMIWVSLAQSCSRISASAPRCSSSSRADRILAALQLSGAGRRPRRFPTRPSSTPSAATSLAVDAHARTDERSDGEHALETAMVLASIHDPDLLLETMAGRITEAMGCDLGAVHLLDETAPRCASPPASAL
jgi:hypothetical protein